MPDRVEVRRAAQLSGSAATYDKAANGQKLRGDIETIGENGFTLRIDRTSESVDVPQGEVIRPEREPGPGVKTTAVSSIAAGIEWLVLGWSEDEE